MSTEEKLALLVAAVQRIAIGTSDSLTSRYCVTMLIEVGEEERVEELFSFTNAESDPTLA